MLIVWIGGGFFGGTFVVNEWDWPDAAAALVWFGSLFLGFGCAWLFTGQKYDPDDVL